VTWGDRVALAVTLGTLAAWDPTGYEERIPTAFGVLPLADPAVTRCPRAVVRPAANGEATIEIRMTGKL
jgi:hypothetical protein